MNGSVHMDQELLKEVKKLRARVAKLEREREQALAHGQQELESLRQTQPLDNTFSVDERHAALEAVFDTIEDALVVYTPSGDIIRANRAFYRLLNIEQPLEYIQQPIEVRSQLIHMCDEHGEPMPEESWPVRRVLRGEVLANGDVADIIFMTMDGRQIHADVSGAPMLDSAGNITGAVLALHDVTLRKQQEQFHVEETRRMDEFLSIASHELRTPMTTINGNIQLAKRRVKGLSLPDGGPAGYEDKLTLILELLSRAERQVRIQNRLVGDLLDVSRIQANRLELNVVDCDLAEITREAVEDQRFAVPNRTILLHDVPADVALPIQADADRISQVVTNFLTNALKYSAADRVVEVQIELQGKFARVSVRDEGPGLSAQNQVHLWERFYRVPGIEIQSGSGMGLGLGLYICHTIIALHQGQIGVDSKVGEGSTFWFRLPLA